MNPSVPPPPPPIPYTGAPQPAITGGPDAGTIRQWEARVRRLVRNGARREEILYVMSDANWPYDAALDMVRRIASRERWKAVAMMVGFGILALLGVVITVVSLTSANGGVVYLPVVSVAGFIYGIVRLVRVKA